MKNENECFISVDVETAGPVPGEFSMLSIGACAVSVPEQAFECELKPINTNSIPEAMAVTGMSLDELTKTGLEPREAMLQFADWIATVLGPHQKPVFVGLNAPFDWSFINYYFHKYCSENPFGFTALDIKAFYFGKFSGVWGDTKSSAMSARLKPKLSGDHTALADARYQAELFRLIQAFGSKHD
ncbi:MAG: 3'-5' exonuclease [Planctomycetaceae bacterium]|nr:3'-5' exonuclease [Planctomycetaceae bacterium]